MLICPQPHVLEARIRATNMLNAELNKYWPLLVAWLTPFIGDKVILNGGGWAVAVRNSMPVAPAAPYRGYVNFGKSHVWYYADYWQPDKNGHSVYTKKDHILCDTDGQNKLAKVYTMDALLRTDWTFEEVIGQFTEWNRIDTEQNRRQSTLSQFAGN